MDTEINVDLNMYVCVYIYIYTHTYILPSFVHLEGLGTAMPW